MYMMRDFMTDLHATLLCYRWIQRPMDKENMKSLLDTLTDSTV